jgi:hypothetical protein
MLGGMLGPQAATRNRPASAAVVRSRVDSKTDMFISIYGANTVVAGRTLAAGQAMWSYLHARRRQCSQLFNV